MMKKALSASPVMALSMEKRLGITVEGLDWVGLFKSLLGIIKGYKEGCLLYGIQGLLVLTVSEKGLPCIGPWCPKEIKGGSESLCSMTDADSFRVNILL